jgi:hypothetical protein
MVAIQLFEILRFLFEATGAVASAASSNLPAGLTPWQVSQWFPGSRALLPSYVLSVSHFFETCQALSHIWIKRESP